MYFILRLTSKHSLRGKAEPSSQAQVTRNFEPKYKNKETHQTSLMGLFMRAI